MGQHHIAPVNESGDVGGEQPGLTRAAGRGSTGFLPVSARGATMGIREPRQACKTTMTIISTPCSAGFPTKGKIRRRESADALRGRPTVISQRLVITITARRFRPGNTELFPPCRPVEAPTGGGFGAGVRAPAVWGGSMFEQEIEMEQKSSSVVPLLLILALVAVIVGTAGYWFVQARKVLTQPEATTVVTAILKAQGPAMLRFHTGTVKSSMNEKPRDPHYKLLERAGMVKIAPVKGKNDVYNIALTPKGETELTAFPEFHKTTEKDGTLVLTVPLARRKLLEVTKVAMNGPSMARVEYTWKWEPTPVGDLFDANGKLVKAFSIWDTQTLIEKYGANFYHGENKRTAVNLVKSDKGSWQVMSE
jgi:hypothetical protein